MDSKEQDDPYVIHGKNLIAEVDVTAHSQLLSFLLREGLSVESEPSENADTVRVHVSGAPEKAHDSVKKFRVQHPETPVHIVRSGGSGNAGGHHSG